MKPHTTSLICAVLLLAAVPLSAATFTANGPTTTNNDDSCDISLLPAATLLVPYFEVDLAGAGAQTTILTVTNTSHLPQAVAMTLWTDYGFPVLTFRYYLTGYDVQSINLFDVIRRGIISGEQRTGSDISPVGELSGTSASEDFDNPQLEESTCVNMPNQLPQIFLTRMQEAFTLGRTPSIGTIAACSNIGGQHANAVGYVTIDVVAVCDNTTLPTDPGYFGAELGYSNVLMGDYLQVDGTNDFAQGSPMVHIRAIPEGGTVATRKGNNFRRTFYSHLQPAASRTRDARQPLPSTFAARWIEGGATGFVTLYKIWRGSGTPASAACPAYAANGSMPVTELVRFDEEENPETIFNESLADPPMEFKPTLPAASLVATASHNFPINTNDAVAGWMYLNLDNGGDDENASQNWVVSSMRAEDRFSVDTDALALGNGCSPPAAVSNANVKDAQPIGPAPNTNP